MTITATSKAPGRSAELTVEIARRIDDIALIKPAWDKLFHETDGSPYFSAAWISAWIEHCDPPPELRICLVSDGEGPLAVIPLVADSARFGQNVFVLAGGGWATRSTCIFSQRADGLPVIPSVVNALHRSESAWLYLRLSKVPRDSDLMKSVREKTASGHVQGRSLVSALGSSVVIDLPHNQAEYKNTLPRNHRKNISRCSNALERLGPVTLRRAGLGHSSDDEALESLIEDALWVSERSWQGSSTTGTAISDPSAREFFRAANKKMAMERLLDLSVLYSDGKPISFLWGAARWPYTSISKLAFDKDFAKQGPGLVHLSKMIADSIDRGGKEIDFGHEFSDYKHRWSQRRDELVDLSVYGHATRSKLAFLWHRLRSDHG